MITRRVVTAMAVVAVALLAMVPMAGATPEKLQAQVLGPVRIDPGDASRAFVTLRYICPSEGDVWFWVSAKQSTSGRPDPALQEEGSSQVAAAWLQSHPLSEVDCDGRWHTESFEINTDPDPEIGGWGGHGTLEPGQVWVQICLIAGEEIAWPSRWAAAR